MWGLLLLLTIAGLVLLVIAAAIVARQLSRPPRRTIATNLARELPIEPSDLGAAYTSHTLPSPTGDLDVWLVEGLAHNGPAMLLLHGWADSRLGSLVWLPMLRSMASKLVLFDRCGHGDSVHGRCTWGDLEPMEAATVARWMSKQTGGGPIVAVGHSMGAVIALDLAANEPQLIRAVVADSPYRFPHDVIGRTMTMKGVPTWPILPLALRWAALRHPRIRTLDTAEIAGSVRQPVLLIQGTRDAIIPLQHAREIAAHCARGRLELFEDADHLQAAAVDPDRYQRVMTEFLADVR